MQMFPSHDKLKEQKKKEEQKKLKKAFESLVEAAEKLEVKALPRNAQEEPA